VPHGDLIDGEREREYVLTTYSSGRERDQLMSHDGWTSLVSYPNDDKKWINYWL
jgi:hypothetical protein